MTSWGHWLGLWQRIGEVCALVASGVTLRSFTEIAAELRDVEHCTNAWKLTLWEPATVHSLHDEKWVRSVDRVNHMGRWYRRGRHAYFVSGARSYKVFYAA